MKSRIILDSKLLKGLFTRKLNGKSLVKEPIEKSKLTNLEEILLDVDEEAVTKFIDEKLKYNPKSEYIYNKQIPSEEQLHNFSKEQIINYFKDLVSDHFHVCRENEQFRTRNLKQHIQLKRYEKLGVSMEVSYSN